MAIENGMDMRYHGGYRALRNGTCSRLRTATDTWLDYHGIGGTWAIWTYHGDRTNTVRQR